MENVTRYKCQMSGCPIVSTIEAPVCEEHLEQIGRIWSETRSVAGTFLALKNEMKRKSDLALAQIKTASARPDVERPEQPFAECVYYVRIGDHIKIGTTARLKSRLRSLYVDHDPSLLLAIEPGNQATEHMRHTQFMNERVWINRELFNPSRRLLAHIDLVNSEHAQARTVAAQLCA